MARLRRDGVQDTPSTPQRPLRIVASGTLFLTHTLDLPCYPAPATAIRAQAVAKTRGGSATNMLSLLAQFSGVESMLVAALGGNTEGRTIIRELQRERVSTKYCKIWEGQGVPCAWVLHAGESFIASPLNKRSRPKHLQATRVAAL